MLVVVDHEENLRAWVVLAEILFVHETAVRGWIVLAGSVVWWCSKLLPGVAGSVFFCVVGQPQFMDFSVRVKHGGICVCKLASPFDVLAR